MLPRIHILLKVLYQMGLGTIVRLIVIYEALLEAKGLSWHICRERALPVLRSRPRARVGSIARSK